MDRISVDQLRNLSQGAEPPCVSIYLPTHRKGRDTQGDSIRLKNLLNSAEEQLIARGMRPTLARDMLQPARDLMEDSEFWMQSKDGMALFVAPGFFKLYKLPIETDDLAMVNNTFNMKPLLPLLGEQTFHVLVLSMNDVRLLECARHRCERVPLPDDVATRFTAAIGSKDHHVDRGLWRHGGGVQAQNQVSDSHGHGPDQDNEMLEDIAFYMRQLDDGVRRAIGEETFLVVAGVDSTTPHFMKVAKRKNIHPEIVPGNHEHTDDELVRDKALALLDPVFHKEMNSLQERFGNAKAQGLASSDVVQILKAAGEGRVDTLIVSPTAVAWGTFDAETSFARQKEDGGEDLVDLAVKQTLLTSGTVVVAQEDQVPGNREAAAIYRY